MLDFGGSWEDRLDLIKFSYDDSYHASIQMTLFETLYGRRCRSPLRVSLKEYEVLHLRLFHNLENQKVFHTFL